MSKKTIAWGVLSFGCPVVPWEVSLPSIYNKVGTSSNATLTTPHSQLNNHFELTTLDLLSINHKNNHNSLLILGYKYEKVKKERVVERFTRKLGVKGV